MRALSTGHWLPLELKSRFPRKLRAHAPSFTPNGCGALPGLKPSRRSFYTTAPSSISKRSWPQKLCPSNS